jgi:hypothetical protein
MVERMREGRRGGWLVLQGMLLQVFFSFYIAQDLHASSLLLPNTTRQRGEGLLQFYFNQRCVRVLEGSMGWFGEVFK